jgi:replicative DNA helicase
LVSLAQYFGASSVVPDSLKDVATDFPKDKGGAGISRSFQHASAGGIEVVVSHHQRKVQPGAGKPRYLSDVYGSRLITASCGSVLMLWGDAGDPVVELTHLKQPAGETIGPLTLIHDHLAGVTTAEAKVDAWTLLQVSTKGTAAADVARRLFGSTDPTKNDIEKARRKLERLVNEGKAHKEDGVSGGRGGGAPSCYYPLAAGEMPM